MRRIRRFAVQYVAAVLLLWDYGERAWPWNVQFVWSHVGEQLAADPSWRADG